MHACCFFHLWNNQTSFELHPTLHWWKKSCQMARLEFSILSYMLLRGISFYDLEELWWHFNWCLIVKFHLRNKSWYAPYYLMVLLLIENFGCLTICHFKIRPKSGIALLDIAIGQFWKLKHYYFNDKIGNSNRVRLGPNLYGNCKWNSNLFKWLH